MNQKGFSPLIIIILILVILVIGLGAFITRDFWLNTIKKVPQSSSAEQISDNLTTLESEAKVITPSTGGVNNLNQFIATESTEKKNSNFREIIYVERVGWPEFVSGTGYSFRSPQEYKVNITNGYSSSGEILKNGFCEVYLTDNTGGTISIQVHAYDGKNIKDVFRTLLPDEYTRERYTEFEEVFLQGRKGILSEPTEPRDYGESAKALFVDSEAALLVSWSNKSLNDPEFLDLLQSIKITGPLKVSNCGK